MSKVDVHSPRAATTTHIGRAGETFVASHLLRLGHNATVLPVDTGVDVMAHWTTATGDSRVALCQVKTTQQRRTTIALTAKELDRFWTELINLVVVFWYEPAHPFALVLPPAFLYLMTSGGYKDPRAPLRKFRGKAALVVASPKHEHAYVRNRYNDVSGLVNRFDRIAATDEDPFFVPDYAETFGGDDRGYVYVPRDAPAGQRGAA